MIAEPNVCNASMFALNERLGLSAEILMRPSRNVA
jgi:hypothetical protein